MRKIFLLFIFIFISISCKKENKYIVDVSNIKVDMVVNRFDRDFYESSINDLPKLKSKYPEFFPESTPDSIWIQKKQNKDELELYKETKKIFQDFSDIEQQLESLFKHVKFYYPDFEIPKVTTVLSNIDYEYRVIYSPSDLIISLDVYLGKTHPFYGDYPGYIKENNTKEALLVDVANEIINRFIPLQNNRTFLDKIIYQGKKKYMLDLLLPYITDKLKSGYTDKKLKWAETNKEQVWRYFIEKDLLYSSDSDLDKRFIELAPFSKFFLKLDNESPGQIGVWLGWQIVRSFMEKNDVSLQELMEIDTQELFKKSKYKPRN